MASEELAIYVRMKDFASKEAAKIGQSIKGISQHVFNLKNAVIGLAGGFGAIKLIDLAVEFEEVGNAFGFMAKGIGGSKAALEGLRKGVSGTVNDLELMRLGNEALMKDVVTSAEGMEQLATVAHELGKALGHEAAPALDQLITGLASQNARSLRSLGLIVDATAAEKEYAREHGLQVKQLGEFQKSQAFFNATMEKAAKIIRSMGPDVRTLGDAWGSFKANLANLGLDTLKAFTPMLRDTFDYLAKWIKDNKPTIVETGAAIVDVIGYIIEALSSLIATIDRTVVSLAKLGQADIWDFAIGPGGKAISETLAKRLGITDWIPWAEEQNKGAEKIEEVGKAIRDKFHGVAESIRRGAQEMREAEQEAALLRVAKDLEKYGPPKFEWQGPTRPSDIIAQADREHLDMLKESWGLPSPEIQRELDTFQQKQDELDAEREQKLYEETNLIGGGQKKLKEFKKEFMDFGVTAALALDQVGGAISSNLGDAFTALITGTKSAKQAFSDMARSMINDIIRITMQLMSMTIVKGLFGLAVLGEGGVVPGHLAPRVRGRFAGGSIAGMHGYYELAERGQPEAVIPLRGGAVPVKMLGGRRGGSVVQNIVNVTLNSKSYSSSEERALLLRNAKDIGNIVVQKMQTSFRFREGMAA